MALSFAVAMDGLEPEVGARSCPAFGVDEEVKESSPSRRIGESRCDQLQSAEAIVVAGEVGA